MRLKELTLINFRNFPYQKIDLDPSWNLFYGPNAQGKTNLLESIYLAAHGSSFKKASDKEMIRFGERSAYVKAVIEKEERMKTVEIKLSMVDKKRIRINEVEAENIKELSSQFEVVFFSPQDLFLVKGGPALRRNYLDELIKNMDSRYNRELRIYEKVLYQRNQLLKQHVDAWYERQMDVLDQQLAEAAAPIFSKRYFASTLVQKYADQALRKLTNSKEKLSLYYLPAMGLTEKNSEDQLNKKDISSFFQEAEQLETIRSIFHDKILEERSKDEILGYSSYGPHKDDLVLLINGLSSRKFASQGQVRTLTLALKLAELKIIEEARKTRPILLLDDVFSELDRNRSADLLKAIFPYQTMLTSNEAFFSQKLLSRKRRGKTMKIVHGQVVGKNDDYG